MSNQNIDFGFGIPAATTRTATGVVRGRSGARKAGRLNRVFAFAIIGLVAIAPLPAGSNVPILWAFWSGVIFVALALHAVLMARLDPNRPLNVLQHRQWVAPALCLTYLAWTMFQTLPLNIGAPLPGGINSAAIAVLPQAAWLGLLRQFGYLALFVLTLEVSARNDRADAMIRVLFWAICVHAMWAMIALRFLGDIAPWGEKTVYLGTATGTFINRNNFAAFLGVGFVLGAAIVADLANVPRARRAGSVRAARASAFEILVPCVGMGLLFVTLLATQSRMGLVAAVLGAAIVFAIMRRRQGTASWRVWGEALILATLLLGPVVVTLNSSVVERALDIGHEANGRLVLWQQVLGMIGARPLTGYGLDSFYAAFELFHRPPLSSAVVWEYAHNSYLSLWAEAGVIAGSLPVLAGGIVIWRALRRALHARTHFAVPAAGVGVGVALAVSSGVDFPLEIQANMLLFVVLMAVASAARGQQAGG